MTGEEAAMIWLDGTGVFRTGLLFGIAVMVGVGLTNLACMIARHLWRRAWGL